MDLCHCLKLDRFGEISHVICPQENTTGKITKLSFYPFGISTTIEENKEDGQSYSKCSLEITLSLKIVDDEEKKPLLTKASPSLSLLLIADIIEGIRETLYACDLKLISLGTNPETNNFILQYALPAKMQNHELLRSALIVRTSVDALLFVRGLQIAAAQVSCASASVETYLWNFSSLEKVLLLRQK